MRLLLVLPAIAVFGFVPSVMAGRKTRHPSWLQHAGIHERRTARLTRLAETVRRSQLVFSVSLGGSFFVGADSSSMTHEINPGGGIQLSALWRPVPYIAVGGHGGFSAFRSDYPFAGLTTQSVGMLLSRVFFPLSKTLDIWLDLGIGYGVITQAVDYWNAISLSWGGFSSATALGIEYFVNPRVSIGAQCRAYHIFPARYCIDNTCARPLPGLNPGVMLTAGAGISIHYSIGD